MMCELNGTVQGTINSACAVSLTASDCSDSKTRGVHKKKRNEWAGRQPHSSLIEDDLLIFLPRLLLTITFSWTNCFTEVYFFKTYFRNRFAHDCPHSMCLSSFFRHSTDSLRQLGTSLQAPLDMPYRNKTKLSFVWNEWAKNICGKKTNSAYRISILLKRAVRAARKELLLIRSSMTE